MVEMVTAMNVGDIRNDALRKYAQEYADIERDFMEQVAGFGLPFAGASPDITCGKLAARVDALEARGVQVENGRKSLWWNWISPACKTCRRGVGTETFLASTQCPRDCFFCFNPNQQDYEYWRTHVHNMAAELDERLDMGVRYLDLAVTGGEPLLHPQETLAFFREAQKRCPSAYTRLYTSGSGLTEEVLAGLEAAGLSEIRFSVKLEDPPALIDRTLELMRRCMGRIPAVLVEMPVMPDAVPAMKELLVRLDALGCAGINLLELCFPANNAPEFAQRGYVLKARPYRVLYNYMYAGGLPVHGSEEACIELLEFAVDAGLRMGVHYCSLENKFTGEVYQHNRHIPAACPWHIMSERDYFLKSAKAFGTDAILAQMALTAVGESRMEYSAQYGTLEFPCEAIAKLAAQFPNMELAISYNIAEEREGQPALRELALARTTPATFNPEADL